MKNNTSIVNYIMRTHSVEWAPLVEEGVNTNGIDVKSLRETKLKGGRLPSCCALNPERVTRTITIRPVKKSLSWKERPSSKERNFQRVIISTHRPDSNIRLLPKQAAR